MIVNIYSTRVRNCGINFMLQLKPYDNDLNIKFKWLNDL